MIPSCDLLTQIGEQKRKETAQYNVYGDFRVYTQNDVNATTATGLADDPNNVKGKGTGVYLDTKKGGSSVDQHGNPALGSFGRDAIFLDNFYTPNSVYDCK